MPSTRRKTRVVPIHAPKPQPIHPFDRLYGTDTGGLIPGKELLTGHPNDAHLTAYYAVAPSILNALIELWLQMKPAFAIDRYTFLDVGAGKGRALMAASLYPFHEAVGIELNPKMAAITRANLKLFAQRASPLCPVRLLEGDALEVPLPATPAVAFLFHPFEAPVLSRFVRRIEDLFESSPDDVPGQFDLLYVNAEHAEVLDRSTRFRRLFHGIVPMIAEDHLADLAEIAGQKEYGSTGDEICAIYRLKPRDRHGRECADQNSGG
jgi:SAM-dependent methyltransferase